MVQVATSSILTTVHLKTKNQVKNLVRALEKSKNMPTKEVVLTKSVREMKRKDIEEMFTRGKKD